MVVAFKFTKTCKTKAGISANLLDIINYQLKKHGILS